MTPKIVTPKIVTNDEAVTGSKKFFVAILGIFGRYVTNLRGTFVENVKKSKINPPCILYTTVSSGRSFSVHMKLPSRL
jgi:hypothetical protein